MFFDSLSPWDAFGVPLTRVALNFSTLLSYAVPPCLGCLVCAFLAIKSYPRFLRIAGWFIVAFAALRAAVCLDLSLGKPERKFLEVVWALMMFSIASRTLDWAITREPFVRHMRPANATPSTLMDAFDLAFSHRGIGWNWSRGVYVARETRPSNRFAFVAYAFLSAALHALFGGILHTSVQSFSPTEFRSPKGGSIFDDTLPFFIRYIRASIISVAGIFALYAVFQVGYDLCTIIGILLLGQDPAQWPPTFDEPWRATSVADYWGRRWQQWFRRTFLVLGGYPLSLVFGRVGIVIGSFLASIVFHDIVIITLNSSVESWRMLLSLGMTALGIILEQIFRQVTGKRVGGWAGWIWTTSWCTFSGNFAFDAFARAGLFASSSFLDCAPPARALVERLVTNFDAWLHTI